MITTEPAPDSQPTVTVGRPSRINPATVDQVLSTFTVNRSRRSRHATANDAVLDDLFALD